MTDLLTGSLAVILLMVCVVSYLIGSLPFAVLSSRLFSLPDPRSHGSGNPGATNVLRTGHKGAALLTLVGDATKGSVAVLLTVWFANREGLSFQHSQLLAALAGLMAFLGHVYSVFLKFKGGKGVATAAGVLLALHPGVGLGAIAVWLLTAVFLRYSSLAALLAAFSAPLISGLVSGISTTTIAIALMSMVLVGRHWANMGRLMAGKEPRIGGRAK